jgi:alpha-amylase
LTVGDLTTLNFGPWVVKDWNTNVGGFSVGEYWDANVNTLEWWANNANSSVFDFACYYKMNDALMVITLTC